MRTLRQASRIDYEASEPLTFEGLRVGALLRIADAVEKVAANYDALRSDRDHQRGRAERAEAKLDTERRRSRALRAIVEKLKRKEREA